MSPSGDNISFPGAFFPPRGWSDKTEPSEAKIEKLSGKLECKVPEPEATEGTEASKKLKLKVTGLDEATESPT